MDELENTVAGTDEPIAYSACSLARKAEGTNLSCIYLPATEKLFRAVWFSNRSLWVSLMELFFYGSSLFLKTSS